MIKFNPVAGFADTLWEVMSALEFPAKESPLLPHDPKDDTVTIGAGCNLTDGKPRVRDAVYRAMNIVVDVRKPIFSEGTALQREIERKYIKDLDDTLRDTSKSFSDRVEKINQVMASRAGDTRLNGFADNRRSEFKFNNLDEARKAFPTRSFPRSRSGTC